MSEKTMDSQNNTNYVTSKTPDGMEIQFILNNVNYSIANALRRVIISDIPCVVFKTFPHEENLTKIHKNTSRLNNEILRQRLECIPVHIKDLSLNFDELQIELDVKNTENVILNVTTKDFKIKDLRSDTYLTEDAVKNIFPPDPFTKDFIIFCRLRQKISNDVPGEEINLTSKLSIHTAKESGAYNVASMCAYSYSQDKLRQDDVWQKKLAELSGEEKNPENIELIEHDWRNHDAKRIYKKDSFDFKLESVGVFSAYTLVKKACEILISRLQTLREKAGSLEIPIDRSDSTMPWSLDVTLKNESYTIGKVIEYMLNKKYFTENKLLTYVGFRQDHPHDTDSFIRLSFDPSSENEPTYDKFKTATNTLIQDVCNESIVIFRKIMSEFN
jgi:DNA-directed RNA polymerase subunit L